MKTVFEVFYKLQTTNSNKEKIQILMENKYNDKLKEFLYRCYNPYIVYNIQKLPSVPVKTIPYVAPEVTWVKLVKILEDLNTRAISGNLARDVLFDFLSSCTLEEQNWYSKLIQKDLKIGITETTINKVWSELIPTFDVQLAEDLKGEYETSKFYPRLAKSLLVEPKLDGMRLLAMKKDSEMYLYSRNGRLLFGFDDLARELKEILPDNTVFDGELMSTEFEVKLTRLSELYNSGDVETATALLEDDTAFGELMTSAFAKKVSKKGIYNVFDVLSLEEFESKTSNSTTLERKSRLDNILKDKTLVHIKPVPSIPMDRDNVEGIISMYETCLKYGYEGIMLKDPDSKYLYRRGWNVAKLKPFISVDVVVDRLYEGKPGTKFVGMLGGATITYEGEEVNIGGGWDEKDRAYYWNNPNELIGHTIEVHAQGESKDKNGKLSLRFPRFKCVRQDK